MADVLPAAAFIVVSTALGWWLLAPVIVSMGDRRLKGRNPDHHKKIVRFYRIWGFLAIAVGLAISFSLR